MSFQITDLPPELVIKITDYLKARELSCLGQTCTLLQELCKTEIIWQRLCHNAVGELDADKWGVTYYEIYSQVIYKYGVCCGLWRRELLPHGGLLQVKVEDGELVATEYHPPCINNILGPLRAKKVFSIGINKSTKKTEVLCLHGYGQPHQGQITFPSVQAVFEIGHVGKLKDTPTPEGYTHDWTLFVKGPPGTSIEHFVKKVVFTFPKGYPEETKEISSPPYEIKYPVKPGPIISSVEVELINSEKARFLYEFSLDKDKSFDLRIKQEKMRLTNQTEDMLDKLRQGGCEFTGINFSCYKMSEHVHPEGTAVEFQNLIREVTDNHAVPFTNLCQARLQSYVANVGRYRLSKIKIQPNNPVYPIQPGLFLAHYSAHGVEMFLLRYDLEIMEAEVIKITGDPNVPSGETSIVINLRKPLRLTLDQQTSLAYLEDGFEDSIPKVDKIEPYDQDLILPPNFHAFTAGPLPDRCKYRFVSKGQISPVGFSDPSFTPVHVAIISECNFMAFWLEFRRAYLYIPIKIKSKIPFEVILHSENNKQI